MRVNAIDLRNIIESETGLKFNRGEKKTHLSFIWSYEQYKEGF